VSEAVARAPAPDRIEVEERARVTLTWGDDTYTLDAATLRAACACADCRSDQGIVRKQAVLGGPAPVTIDGAELRGAYAISFLFGPDHHGTGIFTWDLLRALVEGDALGDGEPDQRGAYDPEA
jgi:DUF971 family protein